MKGSIDLSSFKEFKDRIDKIDTNNLLIDCTLGLTKKYLKSVTMLTPVDTGNLKGEWHNTTPTIKSNGVQVDIVNSADYASYVEYGHRTRGGRGWVNGRYMMTKTEQIIEDGAPKYLEHKIKKFLEALDK